MNTEKWYSHLTTAYVYIQMILKFETLHVYTLAN